MLAHDRTRLRQIPSGRVSMALADQPPGESISTGRRFLSDRNIDDTGVNRIGAVADGDPLGCCV